MTAKDRSLVWAVYLETSDFGALHTRTHQHDTPGQLT